MHYRLPTNILKLTIPTGRIHWFAPTKIHLTLISMFTTAVMGSIKFII